IGGAFMTTSHFAFIAASPYIVQQNLSLAPEDSAYFVTFTLFGFSLGNLLIKVIYTPLGPKNTLLVGASLGLCSAFSLLLLSLNGTLNSFLLAFLLLMITTGGGICGAPALALALSLHPHISGT